MRKEIITVVTTGLSVFGLYELSKCAFSKRVKLEAWERAGEACEICGRHVPEPQNIHHKIPAHALRRIGIEGNNNVENAACLCNDGPDHHQLADMMAIRERKFWNGSAFVSIQEMPPITYRRWGKQRS